VTAALQNPFEALVTMQFSRLTYLGKFENGAYCKGAKRIANLKTAPKPENKNYNHFTPISAQANTLLKV
jgi:hypothetical protein